MQPDLVPRGCWWGTAGIRGWSPARLACWVPDCGQPGSEVAKQVQEASRPGWAPGAPFPHPQCPNSALALRQDPSAQPAWV